MGLASESSNIVHFFENKTILITGGTGFLAKVLLEKILRIQPNIAKIYLIIRASDNMSLTQRFRNEVMGKDLFKVLRSKYGANIESFISEKVVPIAGDISDKNLGLKDSNTIEKMLEKMDIIVNLAATTNFHERYDVAMGINTWGALHVLRFAKRCINLKMLVHVSTAYVCGEEEGLIQEKPFKMGETLLKDGKVKLDINSEKNLVEDKLSELKARKATNKAITSSMIELGLKRAKAHGWPNTYVFTKAMGEMLLGKFKNDLPLIILRPAVVSSTYQQPFPGWIEGLRSIDGILGGYGNGTIKCLPYDPDTTIDIIPADMTVNLMLVAIVVHVNRSTFGTIYHIGSSSKNPISILSFTRCFFDYFTKNPLPDRSGKPIIVKKLVMFSTMTKFQRYMMTRYILPLMVPRLINIATFQSFKKTYDDYNGKIESAMRLANMYRPYMFFKGIFDDTNSEKLRMVAREMGIKMEVDDDDGFNFDPMTIDWEDYFMNTHIPGIVNHVILKRPASMHPTDVDVKLNKRHFSRM